MLAGDLSFTLRDLEDQARARVEAPAWAYLQGGAAEERTLRWNRLAFERRTLRPRVLHDVGHVETASRILERPVAAPFFVSPTAQHGLFHPEAEEGVARACASRGLLAVYSTLSTRSLESIAQATPNARRWFQLYVHRDPEVTRALIRRAQEAGYEALVVTVDAPVLGMRDREDSSGFRMDPRAPLGNLPGYGGGPEPLTQARHFALRTDPGLTWERVRELCRGTPLPVILKGILTEEDARRASETGVRGIVVSNHGGRQLDGAPPTLRALPAVLRGAGDRLEVYLDGGVRRGSDIAVALASGARAVGVGRPVVWALSVGGQAGVERYFGLLQEDLRITLALLGCQSIQELGPWALGEEFP
jgi:4-hydroxymandelate oxidase